MQYKNKVIGIINSSDIVNNLAHNPTLLADSSIDFLFHLQQQKRHNLSNIIHPNTNLDDCLEILSKNPFKPLLVSRSNNLPSFNDKNDHYHQLYEHDIIATQYLKI